MTSSLIRPEWTRQRVFTAIRLSISMMSIILHFIVNAQTWSAFPGGGMNDWVYASTIYNGELIVAGKFTSADGVPANHIAKWNGTTWAPLGLGVNGKVNALAVFNGYLVAAGEFTMAGDLEVNFIAQWDGTTWDDQLGGVGSTVTSLAVIGSDLYVGGYFTEADNVPAFYIAKRNDDGWFPLGSGMGGSQGQVMALTVFNGELYAGGFFTTAGGLPANHIARWNGTAWSALGSGISNIVYSLTEYNGNLVAGGLFTSAGGVPANNIAAWNGSSWSPFGSGMGGILYQYVLTLGVYNGNLIAGGYFTTSGGVTTNGIAKWDGIAWSDMGGGLFYPANVCGAHTLCVYGSDLVVGGLFFSAGAVATSHIAKWNESLVPANITLSDDTVFPTMVKCFDATQNITVAGGGASFVVQDGGSSTFIAGENINLLPGTKVDSGGYLLGTITLNGQYCGNTAMPASTSLDSDSEYTQESVFQHGSIKIFPNPTTGDFSLTVTEENVISSSKILIYSAMGKAIAPSLSRVKDGINLSLKGFPDGIYFLHLTSETGSYFCRMIKRK